jgi:hypothetical protein
MSTNYYLTYFFKEVIQTKQRYPPSPPEGGDEFDINIISQTEYINRV